MTNGIYFFNTIREEWSASTSPNETPRPSFVEAGDLTVVQQASSSSTSTSSGAIGGGSSTSQTQIPPGDGGKLESSNLKNFSFEELKAVTSKFRADGVLGEGDFGKVYKGWIDKNTLTATKPERGIAVAVKRLNKQGFQGGKEWSAEVNYLGTLYHPNLVRLLGHCFDKEEYLLVYEFMPRGSLENHLFRSRSLCPLSWGLRMKVVIGAAKGLAFLHTVQINVIHRNVHCSNILLDSDFNPKLSDFGLARDGPTGDMSHVSTRVMGAYGYAAPEYIATGHLNSKSDVYGFGVVLLEILSGRRTIDQSRPSKERNLVEWAMPYLKHKQKIFRVLDSHLKGHCPLEDALKVATLAYHCLSSDPKCRPNMNEVAMALEELQISE